ncbi:receptor-type tyrosine-protein phosphatase eta-like [Megalops cyprinoides]|uniref:receptor-type tyrosine-protein phosphatase eta-like n=1 Tax=Megalops cyprinoides TaxID=118141 RepID=UPI001864E80A|nr:receptor-type tyrosine-protein phosphatase eta-like [Megalops cyprinoides]
MGINTNITKMEYNMFVLKFSTNLLNSENGPIVAYGILVTSGDGPANLSYLTNTWTQHQKTPYLALIQNNTVQTRNGENTITVDVGSGSKYEGYYNGPLTAKTTYRFGLVLFTRLKLDNKLVKISESYVTFSDFEPNAIRLPENPAVIGGAVAGMLAFLVILICITVILTIHWRRIAKKDSADIPIQPIRGKVSIPIRVEDYEVYYKKQRADSNCGFAEEFEDLKPVGVSQAKVNALALENKGKNRYNNVLPYDSSRVKLSINGSPFDDYINANYMPGYNSKKEYIAAQGPLPATVNEFWRMIWEKNVHTLVMLTRCNEQGRVKCEEYWPSKTKHFNNITVTTTSEIPLEDWTIRDFDVKNVKTAETRALRHFHFTAWPDHGVPETTELLINFRHLVREHMEQFSRNSPTVVHCSAGVGRTGTFIAIDRLIYQIERESMVDVYGIVHDLRMHRPLMVQTEDQYVFLNQCAMDIIKSRTGTNVDLIYQNTAALTIYENIQPMKGGDGCPEA